MTRAMCGALLVALVFLTAGCLDAHCGPQKDAAFGMLGLYEAVGTLADVTETAPAAALGTPGEDLDAVWPGVELRFMALERGLGPPADDPEGEGTRTSGSDHRPMFVHLSATDGGSPGRAEVDGGGDGATSAGDVVVTLTAPTGANESIVVGHATISWMASWRAGTTATVSWPIGWLT